MWAYICTITLNPLTLELCHPCSITLSFTWVEVNIEYSQITTILVVNLIRFYIWMINRYILVLFEGNTIKTCSQAKDSLDYIA